MTKAKTTRTLNRLPFDELEPKRFEDLIRQLIYDFRTWRQLEATGRAGSDDGYDARGWEIITDVDDPGDVEDGEQGDLDDSVDRKWMVQCKREKAIGPKKLQKYLDEIGEEDKRSLHGFIFAACCDFSLESRDVFRKSCREAGLRECYIWGRGEVEDQLFQPKNDHLLFAYFGISLRIRKRSVKTAVRSRLTMKRKATRLLQPHRDILIRDGETADYPYRDKGVNRLDLPWRVRKFVELHPRGVRVRLIECTAYLAEDGKHWDIANMHNEVGFWDNAWFTGEEKEKEQNLRQDIFAFSNSEKLSEGCKGRFEFEFVIPYDYIIDIDGDGDEYFRGPHLYVDSDDRRSWLSFSDITIPPRREERDGRFWQVDEGRHLGHPRPDDRVEFFPPEMRKMGPL